MPFRKQHPDETDEELFDQLGRIVGVITLLYLLALIGSWFTNRAQFWKLAAYGLLTVLGVVGVLLGWRQIQVKLRLRKVRKLRDSIQRSGQGEYILNFINRFRMEGEGNRGWSFRNHHFDWNRISDLEKVLVERGVPLNLQIGKRGIFTVLRLFIQEKEENLTRASIERAPQLFSQLRGDDFEKLLCCLFEAMGYVVQHVGKSGDQGGDVIANKDGERILIQAKCYRDWSVGNEAVQQAVGAMRYYDCNKTMVITTSGNFTKEAVALAQANATELVSKPRLSELLATHLGQVWR